MQTSEIKLLRGTLFNAVDYGRDAGTGGGEGTGPVHRRDRGSDLEVMRADGALEVNNEHDGIEVHSPIDWEPRSSIPISALTELPNDKSFIERSSSNIVGEVIDKPRACASLNRRGRIIFAAIIVLIIVAVVGAVTGTVLSRKPQNSEILPSNLAAVNWTTAANATIYVVFSQETDGSLIAHRQEAGNWTKVNISHIFQDTGSSLGIRASTPLAAAAISNPVNMSSLGVNELSLFYLTPTNTITQIVTRDGSLREWVWGDVGPHSDVKLSAAPGSQMSAAWRRCRDAASGCGGGTLSLTFEDEYQNYLVANSTYNWTATVASSRLAANSSMALISMDYGSASDYLWGFYDTNGVMGSAWEDFQKGNWWWTNLGRNIMYGIPMKTGQGFAAASFHGRTHAFVAALFPDGSVSVKYYDPGLDDWHPEAKLKLANESTETVARFSAIAMTADARLYGMVNSSIIQELRMDQTDPYTFHHVGDIV
ncbi:hypothetical protein PG999_010171 [Apiospora kogelbergensis]|uniref:Fucose-specific lectin n=1 Tax=Apiospora kogelbergensis TaxID=1337665 RepID=A0AAW0QAN8_9PEZI